MKHVRIGFIGTGRMGESHANAFKAISGVELVACHDVDGRRAEAFAKEYGIPCAAQSLDEVIERSDAVSVVTPDRFHADHSIRVLRAGRHLLCEKPLAVTLMEAQAVAREAKRASSRGIIHLVNFSYRRSAALEEAAKIVAAGKIGDLRHVHGFYLQTWLSAPVWGHWTQDLWLWRLQTSMGSLGVLGDVGCHILDLATAVTGSIARVRCDLRTFPKITRDRKLVTEWKGGALDANDTAVIELELKSGALCLLQATRWATGHKNHLRLEAHGTLGAVSFDLDVGEHLLKVCLGKDRDAVTWKTRKLKPARTIYQRFIRAVRTGKPEQPDLIRGAEVQSYLDACERSANSGQWEKVMPCG